MPEAWPPLGPPLARPPSSPPPRLQVFGVRQRDPTLVPDLLDGASDTAAVVAWREPCREPLTHKAEGRRDTAPLPRGNAGVRPSPKWGKKGWMLTEFPPYAPAVNGSEIVWRCLKYSGRPFAAYRACQQLCAAVEAILRPFGPNYTSDCQAA